MRIHKIIIAVSICFIASRSLAQSEQPVKYRKFAVYAGVGPSIFINNLVILKDQVKPFQYAFSARFMWEPKESFLSLGIETGYFKLYTVHSTQPKADISNSTIPLMFDVSMRFSKKFYATWGMGQSFASSKVTNTDSAYNFNSKTSSFSDFTCTFGYHLIQKERISYTAELKGFYSSGYEDATIALLFIVGFRL